MHDNNQKIPAGFLAGRLLTSNYPWRAKWDGGKGVIHSATGADEKASNTTVQLIHPLYADPIQRVASKARRLFNSFTVPIMDPKLGKPSDERACTTLGMMECEKAVGENSPLFHEWKSLVQNLFDDYEEAKRMSEAYLASISVSLPFPSIESLRTKRKSDGTRVDRFRWVLSDFTPVLMDVPLGGIFTNLSPEMVKVKEEKFRRDMEAKFAASHAEPFRQMTEALRKVVERLLAYQGKGKGHGGKFHATLISNLRDMAAAIPAVNIFQDKTLERVASRLIEVTKFDADQLRESSALRATAAESAKSIIQDIKDCGF